MPRPTVAGQPAADRIIRQVNIQHSYGMHSSKGGKVNPLQIATVLHALADHSALMEAVKHRPVPNSPWPEAESIGRWLHDVADDIEAHNEWKMVVHDETTHVAGEPCVLCEQMKAAFCKQ